MDETTVRVFRYEYFDTHTRWWERGPRYATAERIAKMGAVLLGSTGIFVAAHQVGLDGFVCMPAGAKTE
ncbi:MAG TPA: hypothetical protein VFP44_15475 [Usitatibacter sp.]|nr:hypothetical protein [Usitatibacter sp.]